MPPTALANVPAPSPVTHQQVLIIEDSLTFRRILKTALQQVPGVKLAGEADCGEEGIKIFRELHPGVVLLDRQMPGLDGLEVLKIIKQERPATRVILLSGPSHWSARYTFEALRLGAEDFLLKPASKGSPEKTLEHLAGLLADAIIRRARLPQHAPQHLPKPARPSVLAVGASTGGPQALETFFSSFTQPPRSPVLIVQHIPRGFAASLAEQLGRRTPLKPVLACHEMVLEPGMVLLAPGAEHMVVKRQGQTVRVLLNQENPVNFCRPSVDVLFESMAETYGPEALAMVLTGMGCDGLKGAQALRAKGAQVMVQDEISSVVWGMPGAVAKAGFANKILPLRLLAREVEQLFS